VKTENCEQLSDVEMQLDADDVAELAKLRAEQTERMLSDLDTNKQGLAADLQQEGRSCHRHSIRLFTTLWQRLESFAERTLKIS